MTRDLFQLGETLQEPEFDEAREAYGEKGFHRWREPLHAGKMENPDGHACLLGSCGDSIEVFLRFCDNRVCKASYLTDGCSSSQICSSFTVEMALGKNPEELTEITAEAVLKEIGRFPEKEEHCAFLSSAVLQEAVSDYMRKQANRGM